jgi:hypothetical protein
LTYIPPRTKKEALFNQKVQKVINIAIIAAAPILFAIGFINSESDYYWVALVLLASLPIFKFLDWLEYNNAKQMEETDDRSKKL